MSPAGRAIFTLGGVALALLLLPLLMPGGTFDLYPLAGNRLPLHAGFIDLATTILAFSLFALGFNLLFGHLGELSFGHAMFFAIAAYSTALFTKGYDVKVFGHEFAFTGNGNPVFSLVVALVATLVWAFLLARLIVPRSSGIYFSMITLASAQIVFFVAFRWSELTGGEDGLQGVSRPQLAGTPDGWLGDATHMYTFAAIVAFVGIAANYWVINSNFGSVLHAIRENKQRAKFLGYDVDKYRINAFVISSLFPALGGWLWTYFQQAINPDSSSIDYSGRVVMMSLLGGIHSFAGPIVGSALYWDIQNRVSGITTYWAAAIGIIFAVVVIFAPDGVAGAFARLKPKPRR